MRHIPQPRWPQLVTKDLVWLEGNLNYTWLHYSVGRKKINAYPLSWWEKHLPDFLRVHRSVLINPAQVVKWDTYHSTVILRRGYKVPVSRRAGRRLRQIIQATTV